MEGISGGRQQSFSPFHSSLFSTMRDHAMFSASNHNVTPSDELVPQVESPAVEAGRMQRHLSSPVRRDAPIAGITPQGMRETIQKVEGLKAANRQLLVDKQTLYNEIALLRRSSQDLREALNTANCENTLLHVRVARWEAFFEAYLTPLVSQSIQVGTHWARDSRKRLLAQEARHAKKEKVLQQGFEAERGASLERTEKLLRDMLAGKDRTIGELQRRNAQLTSELATAAYGEHRVPFVAPDPPQQRRAPSTPSQVRTTTVARSASNPPLPKAALSPRGTFSTPRSISFSIVKGDAAVVAAPATPVVPVSRTASTTPSALGEFRLSRPLSVKSPVAADAKMHSHSDSTALDAALLSDRGRDLSPSPIQTKPASNESFRGEFSPGTAQILERLSLSRPS